MSLADEGSTEYFDERILDSIWELTAPSRGSSRRLRPTLRVSQNIPLASGLASSSAAALATAWLYGQVRTADTEDRRDPAIERAAAVAAAYEAERRVTNGGGMDHVAIADGGVVLLQGTREPKLPTVAGRVADPGRLGLVVIDSRVTKVCGSHLAWVRRRDAEGNREQARYCQICDALAAEAWSSIAARDWMRLAAAVNGAHEAMRDLQHMSTPMLEKLRDTALAVGFPGVKITGSGSGGCLVAVTRQEDVEDQIRAFRRAARAFTPPPVIIAAGVYAAAWQPGSPAGAIS